MWRERRAAEQAANQRTIERSSEDEFVELKPMLDEAIGWLPRRDREGVILCFFHQCSYTQIGALLGLSEEAARKRVSRAVGRMRAYLESRGVVATAGLITAALTREALAVAPAALVQASVNLATLSHLAGATGSSAAILKGVLHAMLMTKIKVAAACAAIMFGGAATVTAIQQRSAAQQPAPKAIAALDETTLSVDAADNVQVDFICMAHWPAENDEWFSLDGRQVTIPLNPFAELRFPADRSPTHQMLVRISGTDHPGFDVRVPNAPLCLGGFDVDGQLPDELLLLIAFTPQPGATSADVELSLACGEYEVLAESEHHPDRPLADHTTAKGGVAFTHIMETPRGSMVYVAHEVRDENWSIFCTDEQGQVHSPTNVNGGHVGSFNTAIVEFNLPPEQIASLQFKTRPFDKKITARNVTLDPAHPKKAQIVAKQIPSKD